MLKTDQNAPGSAQDNATKFAGGRGEQPDPDHSRQGLLHDPTPLLPYRAVVQTDVAAG
jgi:hypothetical protein